MLFNSPVFLFLFLPAVAIVYAALRAAGRPRAAMAGLVVASIVFYGWWNPAHVPLLLASMAVNYAIGRALPGGEKRWLLATGILLNLVVLGYFKYGGFLAGLAPGAWVALPLGVSFFTFTQIAYLIDTYRQPRDAWRADPLRYAMFVTFFPHLIAGPILHHREMMPQYREMPAPGSARLCEGAALFLMGLAKKMLLADQLAPYVDAVFQHVHVGGHPSFLLTWTAVIAFGLQIYFDFSGYSDMAIGLAKLFGIDFPLNFDSPYRATSMADLWRRWHMTLSRFLRDYVYIPLGGNRHGPLRQYAALFITMLVGGIWHGAGWTFMLWGALQGAYLAVNQAWRSLARNRGWRSAEGPSVGGWVLTMLAVFLSWPLFRAVNLHDAGVIYGGLFGLNEALAALNAWEGASNVNLYAKLMPIGWVLAAAVAVAICPFNSQAIARDMAAAQLRPLEGRLAAIATFALGVAAFAVLRLFATIQPSSFVYFNF